MCVGGYAHVDSSAQRGDLPDVGAQNQTRDLCKRIKCS